MHRFASASYSVTGKVSPEKRPMQRFDASRARRDRRRDEEAERGAFALRSSGSRRRSSAERSLATERSYLELVKTGVMSHGRIKAI